MMDFSKAEPTLFVCTTCGIAWENGRRIGRSNGEKLLDRLRSNAETSPLKDRLSVCPVECMDACDRGCTVSLSASGKYTYLFGDLNADDSALDSLSASVLEFVDRYCESPQGLLRWSERPKLLKKRIIAKIPPVADNR
ncbi:DUF1636 domain-containing protein [Baaleninema sp.]|uniref:DUF1636 domain-containing protein n=1 Tax=Baaleninema sp. TaxID=3101197 RepID=UPI003D00E645